MFTADLSVFSNSRLVHITLLHNCGLLWKAVNIDTSSYSCIAIDVNWNEPQSQSSLCWKALPAEMIDFLFSNITTL